MVRTYKRMENNGGIFHGTDETELKRQGSLAF